FVADVDHRQPLLIRVWSSTRARLNPSFDPIERTFPSSLPDSFRVLISQRQITPLMPDCRARHTVVQPTAVRSMARPDLTHGPTGLIEEGVFPPLWRLRIFRN